MPDVVIDRIGNWYVVAAVGQVYNAHGGREGVYTPYGSFRNINDALDLRRTLLGSLEGKAEAKRWVDPLDFLGGSA